MPGELDASRRYGTRDWLLLVAVGCICALGGRLTCVLNQACPAKPNPHSIRSPIGQSDPPEPTIAPQAPSCPVCEQCTACEQCPVCEQCSPCPTPSSPPPSSPPPSQDATCEADALAAAETKRPPTEPQICGGAAWAEEPGWGVADLLPELRPSLCAGGTSPSAAKSKEQLGASVFMFGVTYDKNHERALGAERVWASKLPGFVWFSTVPDERFRGRMIVLKHCKEPIYNNMVYRMLDIWAHVRRYWGGYDWYMRLWDDNWVDPVTLGAMMKEKGLVDRKAVEGKHHWGRMGGSGDRTFIGGGAGSLLSQGALGAWTGADPGLEGLLKCKALYEKIGQADPYAEDVWFSQCQKREGVILHRHGGFQALSRNNPMHMEPSWERLTNQDIACRKPFTEVAGAQTTPIITMHYVTEEEMKRLGEAGEEGCLDESPNTRQQ